MKIAEFLRKATGADLISVSAYFSHGNAVHFLLLLLIVLFGFCFLFKLFH